MGTLAGGPRNLPSKPSTDAGPRREALSSLRVHYRKVLVKETPL